jgi:hypothetical protein
VNGIVFLVSFSTSLLSLYRNAIIYRMLILYSIILLKVCIRPKSLVESLVFF